MKYAPRYPIQTNWEDRCLSDPQRKCSYVLGMLDFDCEADNRPGILILTNSNHTNASAMAVNNLRKELPKILEHREENTIAYWKEERDEAKRSKMLVELTPAPIFTDILAPSKSS